MANNYDRTIRSSVHIDALNKIDKYVRLAHHHLEEAISKLRADYAEAELPTGSAMQDLTFVLSQLCEIDSTWRDTKRNMTIEAAHDLLTGCTVRKPAAAKVTRAKKRTSAGDLLPYAANIARPLGKGERAPETK